MKENNKHTENYKRLTSKIYRAAEHREAMQSRFDTKSIAKRKGTNGICWTLKMSIKFKLQKKFLRYISRLTCSLSLAYSSFLALTPSPLFCYSPVRSELKGDTNNDDVIGKTFITIKQNHNIVNRWRGRTKLGTNYVLRKIKEAQVQHGTAHNIHCMRNTWRE